jgi:type VI secretion system secreted protein Hcp
LPVCWGAGRPAKAACRTPLNRSGEARRRSAAIIAVGAAPAAAYLLAKEESSLMAMYMKFGNITGDATQTVVGRDLTKDLAYLEGQGWFNISDFKWSIERKITTRSGSQGNARDPKQPSVKEITVKKEADKATTQLLNAICYNNNSETCTVIFVKTGDPGEIYMQYKFSNVFITNININLEQETPVETLEINFTKVEMARLSSDTTNLLSLSTPDRFQFELKQTAPAGPGGSGSGHPPGGHH